MRAGFEATGEGWTMGAFRVRGNEGADGAVVG